jgi:hypothetical protein
MVGDGAQGADISTTYRMEIPALAGSILWMLIPLFFIVINMKFTIRR